MGGKWENKNPVERGVGILWSNRTPLERILGIFSLSLGLALLVELWVANEERKGNEKVIAAYQEEFKNKINYKGLLNQNEVKLAESEKKVKDQGEKLEKWRNDLFVLFAECLENGGNITIDPVKGILISGEDNYMEFHQKFLDWYNKKYKDTTEIAGLLNEYREKGGKDKDWPKDYYDQNQKILTQLGCNEYRLKQKTKDMFLDRQQPDSQKQGNQNKGQQKARSNTTSKK